MVGRLPKLPAVFRWNGGRREERERRQKRCRTINGDFMGFFIFFFAAVDGEAWAQREGDKK